MTLEKTLDWLKKYKDFEQVNLHQDEVLKDEFLNEQINNVSLFNKNKVIFISEISDKIKKKIEDIIEDPNKDVRIFLFAQNLDKKSSLRSIF